jgi:hypothetical protein
MALTDKRDMAGAVTRIKELELSWDAAEAALKPRAANQWHTVDDAIDRALKAARHDPSDAAASAHALKELLAKFDGAQ